VKVQLRIRIAANPDVVWDALRNPEMFRRVSAPLLLMRSEEAEGFPPQWREDGPHRISIYALGFIPNGVQTIDVTYAVREDGTRVVTDAGMPQSGAITVFKKWRHQMAVTAQADGSTLYRDKLEFDAGLLNPIAWLGLWCFWQWRGLRLRQLLKSR
jgi:hypothetical protein